MLTITVPGYEYFDEATGVFGSTQETTLQLEHSLDSLYRWESKWNVPFLKNEKKTLDQCLDYVRCMTLTPNVDPLIYRGITDDLLRQIDQYIEAPMTATWFSKQTTAKGSSGIVTAEVIYYWMLSLNIPFECQFWHLNKLLTLIRVCNAKNAPTKPGKKMTQSMLDERRALNEARRRKYGSRG